MIARPVLARDAVIVAGAVGAGVLGAAASGALAVSAVVLLGALAAALTWRSRGGDGVSRAIPLPLTALIAVFSALIALAVSNGHGTHAHDHSDATVHNHAPH